MSATVMFYKFKAKNSLTDDGYEELLKMVRSLLPPDNILPSSLSSIKKFLKAFDLGYDMRRFMLVLMIVVYLERN